MMDMTRSRKDPRLYTSGDVKVYFIGKRPNVLLWIMAYHLDKQITRAIKTRDEKRII